MSRSILPLHRGRALQAGGDGRRVRGIDGGDGEERAGLPGRAPPGRRADPVPAREAARRGVVQGRFPAGIGPTALLGLLYTIVLPFANKGDKLTRLPLDVVRIAIPLLLHFAIMFTAAFLLSRALGFDDAETASLSFTAAGNNFELAIAVSVGVFGLQSGEALAGVVGPLVEVPALVGLVYVSLWLKERRFPGSGEVLIPNRFAAENKGN